MTTSRRAELTRALQHLQAAQRLLRGALALRAAVAVAKAMQLTESVLAAGQAAQHALPLEADDPAPPAA
jgi:hypothetical protein